MGRGNVGWVGVWATWGRIYRDGGGEVMGGRRICVGGSVDRWDDILYIQLAPYLDFRGGGGGINGPCLENPKQTHHLKRKHISEKKKAHALFVRKMKKHEIALNLKTTSQSKLIPFLPRQKAIFHFISSLSFLYSMLFRFFL